jgi:Flp pilus assembly protein TadB
MNVSDRVYNVTNARVSLSADQASRSRRYLISMSIRVICFVLCVVFTGWLRWAFFIGALILPWVAVVIANAGRENAASADQAVQQSPWLLEQSPNPRSTTG